ncbi:MAG: hypothetical protein QXL57_09105 [Candidatus Bathyarchaeia archaeon]
MKCGQLLNFTRHKATKLFICQDCNEDILPGQHYWRLLSLYKYCDKCYVKMLNSCGYGISKDKQGKAYVDKFWRYHPNTVEEQVKLLNENS